MKLHPEDKQDIIQGIIDGLLAAKKARKPRQSSSDAYTAEFEQIWRAYPRRPNNNKAGAYRACQQRLKEGITYVHLLNRTHKYRQFCEATDKIGKEIVLQASTFFGPNKRYEDDFTPPRGAITHEWAKLPRSNDDLWPFAKKHGYSGPGNLTYQQYREKLTREVAARLE